MKIVCGRCVEGSTISIYVHIKVNKLKLFKSSSIAKPAPSINFRLRLSG